jgi:membrane fusion protein, multidrug efflux system
VTITQLNPIYVDVTQPSATILRLKRELAGGLLRSAGENQVPVTLILEDGSTYDQAGQLQFSEVTVDQGTGSVTLRAIFPNDAGLLLPGMFTRAALQEGVRRAGLLVPQQGVTHNQRGEPTAMIVNADNQVEVRGLTTDRAIGDKWLVTTGVADGDKVIVAGLQKIKSGDRVVIRDVTAAFYRAPAATHAAREDP